jgi:hypothetical protein
MLVHSLLPLDFSVFRMGKSPPMPVVYAQICLPQWKAEIAAGKNKLG